MVGIKERGKNFVSERFRVRSCSVTTIRFNVGKLLFFHAVFYCSMFFISAVPGVEALKFLKDPPMILSSYVGQSVDFNCSTDDPNATVSLLFSDDFRKSWSEMSVTPNKLVMRKQVFTLMNLVLGDGGVYACKATDRSGQTIQWPRRSGYFFMRSVELPRYFVLIPKKSIHVLQGQSGKVTCECEGATVSKLKWEKRQSDGSYAAVPKNQVTVTKDLSTNRVRAVLKITNAQFTDAGTYKCTVEVPPNKSDFKLTSVKVDAPTPPKIAALHDGKVVLLKEGSSTVFKCSAMGVPKPNVTWFRNDKKLNPKKIKKDKKSCKEIAYKAYEEEEDSSGLHTLYTVHVLEIRKVMYPRDQGVYKCVASNGVSDAQTVFDVQVQVDLVKHLKIRPPKPISVLQGQEARFKCDLQGVLTAKLQWKKHTISGDVPVPNSMVTVTKDRATKRIRAVLKIKYAQMQDSGVYKCVSAASGKTHFKLANLTVKESLTFLRKPPKVIRGYLGQNVMINCSTNEDDVAVSLLRKPHPFATSTELKPKANKLVQKRQAFTILNIGIEDAGIYSCSATNKASQTIRWPRFTGYFVLLQEP